jgi:ubiquinone/menaquinone biosynthesis C-methylase UbiE
MTMQDARAHWDDIFSQKTDDEMSWFQATPTTSLALLSKWSSPDDALLDVGAGNSRLIDHLIERGWREVTLLDVSAQALAKVRERLSSGSTKVAYVASDIRHWQPEHHYRVWHDRAVFHFLTDHVDQENYVRTAARALESGAILVIATFSASGPTHCSGLPVARHDPDELARLFVADFELVDSQFENHTTPFHTVQAFSWVVLRRR